MAKGTSARKRKQRRRNILANLPGTLPITADVTIDVAAAAEGEEPKQPTFSMVAYTGAAMRPSGFSMMPVVVDLAGLDLTSKSRPIFLEHDRTARVGHTTELSNDGKQLLAEGVVSSQSQAAMDVVKDAKAGFPFQASIGASVDKMILVDDDETVNVNGRKFTGPVLVARASRLGEISFVALGADDDTSATIAAAAPSDTEIFDMKFDAWLQAEFGLELADLTDEQEKKLRAKFDASNKPEVEAAKDDDEPNDIKARLRKEGAEELERQDKIRKICAKHDNPEIEVNGEQISLAAHAISNEWDVARTEDRAKTEAELAKLRASRSTGPAIHSQGGDDYTPDVAAAAMLMRCGQKLDNEAFKGPMAVSLGLPKWLRAGINDDQKQKVLELAHRFSDMAMLDLCREAVRLDGKMAPPSGRSDLIEAAFSGSTLTDIFTTNVSAVLLAAYNEIGDTTQGWTSTTDVADFKSNERPRMSVGPDLELLPRGKEAKHMERDDTAESYSIARYAKQFVVDEQDIIDDRLNALSDTPQMMGRAAARLRPDLVYAILLANANLTATGRALFNATDGNLDTGSALAASTLQAAITAIQTFQENSVNLNLMATHVIVPQTLRFTGRQLLRSAELGRDDEGPTMNPIVAENLTLVSDARLDNGVTDPASGTAQTGSTTDWYTVAAAAHTIEVAYLRGTGRAPVVRSFMLDKGTWGMGWDVKLDIGAKALDWRGMHKSEE